MAIQSVREARKIQTKRRRELRKATAGYERSLKLVRKLRDQLSAAEATARNSADKVEDAERWVANAESALKEAQLARKTGRKSTRGRAR